MTKEATARIKINKLLEAAAWRFFADASGPANIQLEPSVTIKSTDLDALGDNFEKSGRGFVDFLLLDAKGFPLLVLETTVGHVADFTLNEDILLIPKNEADMLSRSTPIASDVLRRCGVSIHAHVLNVCTAREAEIHGGLSDSIEQFVAGVAQPKLNQEALNRTPIPIPDKVGRQQSIATPIGDDRVLVASKREQIAGFEKETQATVAGIWRDMGLATAGADA